MAARLGSMVMSAAIESLLSADAELAAAMRGLRSAVRMQQIRGGFEGEIGIQRTLVTVARDRYDRALDALPRTGLSGVLVDIARSAMR